MTLTTNRMLLTALLCFGTLSGSVNHTTLARFTTVVDSTGNQFSAGTLQIGSGITTGVLSLGNLVPGDTFDALLHISNPGTLELTYSMTTAITAGSSTLANTYMDLSVRTTSADCAAADNPPLYTGSLAGAFFGSPLHANHLTNRHLLPSATDVLCFTVLLDPATPASQQNTDMTAEFTFAAEQV
ncbi:MAG TPA: TasA family protein [Chloroflexota bacterium]|nr:TasA family protein [Chloroflexota bacterium]